MEKFIDLIKIIGIILIMVMIIFPLLPLKLRFKRLSSAQGLKYTNPDHKKNIWFALLIIGEFVLFAALFDALMSLANFITSLPFIADLLARVQGALSGQAEYIIFVVFTVIFNLIVLYVTILLKGFLKGAILDPTYGFSKRSKFSFKAWREERRAKKEAKKKAKEEKKNDAKEEEEVEETPSNPLEGKRVSKFDHELEEEIKEEIKEDETKLPQGKKKRKPTWLSRIFFEPEDGYIYPKPWAIRVRKTLQGFVWTVEVLYIIAFLVMIISIFYPLPSAFYNILINVLNVQDWYAYPFISLLLLQEICNSLNGPEKVVKKVDEETLTEEEKANKLEKDLRGLRFQLTKRFDADHKLRYFPEAQPKEVKEYQYTNVQYSSALDFIKNRMNKLSGRTVQSYMEALDACYGENNIYFGGSFYSEFGEYLVAYTFTRLLAGSRVVYVVSQKKEMESLRKYIHTRLVEMSNVFGNTIWRVKTSEERLDQTDVLIAVPEDFADDRLVNNNPLFFEETVSTIFLDSDRMVEMQGYLCTIMAMRIQRFSKSKVNFVFLSNMIYRGFTASNLPRFFNCENILTFSSAKENEAVAYTLWNKESKTNRIYNKHGQNLNSLECIIADLAYQYDIDGVRVVTQDPLDHASVSVLKDHDAELNVFHKQIPDVHYMIYSDDGYNLAASLYSCTRFRGKYKSVVNIISKPYLLREYFMYKVSVDDYINRSAFIQPHVTEHVDYRKLALLKLYLECNTEAGMLLKEFEAKAYDMITKIVETNHGEEIAYCKMIQEKIANKKKILASDLASYIVAGLCDNKDTQLNDSVGNRARDFYIIYCPAKKDGYVLSNDKEERISFRRSQEVFNFLLNKDETVSLYLNNKCIGKLDTYPTRVRQEYIQGQSFHFNNTEYEIMSISDDNKSIFLRHENVIFQQTYDTIFLRRYKNVTLREKTKEDGVLVNSHSNLQEIRVSEYVADFVGETYGYYTVMSDHQTLDLAHKAEGNPMLDETTINANRRDIKDGRILKVKLTARTECNDGMRILLTSAFNEFIRTIFPHSYRCLAVVPVLENDVVVPNQGMPETLEEKIKGLYPHLTGKHDFKAKDHEMEFLFINDSTEDIGVLDWFSDKFAHYMEEFIANVYSYLYWLKDNNNIKHYIYFGNDELPSCFDLEGCCSLLDSYNWVLSDEGEKDYNTASHDKVFEETNYCSFCHERLESGRYQKFDDNRLICNDCVSSALRDKDLLEEAYADVYGYLEKEYPELLWTPVKVGFFPTQNLPKGQLLSQYLVRIDTDTGTILVEKDDPLQTSRVSLLRGQIEFWQTANGLLNPFSLAQMYYEEILFLRRNGLLTQANWVYDNIPEDVKMTVDEIGEYVGIKVNEELSDDIVTLTTEDGQRRTSFTFLREKALSYKGDEDDEGKEVDEDSADSLYDPDKTPRFWKHYIYNKSVEDDGEFDGTKDEPVIEEDDTEESTSEDEKE